MAAANISGNLPLTSILEYLDVELKEYKENRKRCLNEGDQILNSHHLLCCGIKASATKIPINNRYGQSLRYGST